MLGTCILLFWNSMWFGIWMGSVPASLWLLGAQILTIILCTADWKALREKLKS